MTDRSNVNNGKNEQLCWNCKRCTNPNGLYCPWAAEGKPVEGWEATEGQDYYSYADNFKSKVPIGKSYNIMACPLYIQDKKFGTYTEAIKTILEVVGMGSDHLRSGKKYRQMVFEKYEELTGEELPYYIKHHAEEFGNFMG